MLSKRFPRRALAAVPATLLLAAATSAANAQTFVSVPALSFTMPVGGANPLPQIVTITSTTSSVISFTQAVSTTSGGAWLSVSPCNPYSCTTPYPVTVGVSAAGLAAGTYQGQVVFTDYSNTAVKLTVPVTLTVAQSTVAFFDNLPGALSFSFEANGSATSQPIQIRNGGSGTLSWTLTASAGTGGSWLSASASSGTAPSTIAIGITVANLPGGGSIAGTFIGQLLFQGAGDSTTIPVAVTVESSVFDQVNPISFTMPVGGASPLPQIVTVAGTDPISALTFTQVVHIAKGGSWLSVSPCNPYSCTTPYPVTVSVMNASSLPAGTYTGEIVITQSADPGMSMTVPVTLTMEEPSGTFFANLPGALSFSLEEGGTAIPQRIQIGNGGTGTGALNWILAVTTSDGSPWLTATPASGTAPSTVNVSVNPSLLPGNGTGTFVGQLLFQTAGDTTTIPVAVTVASTAGSPVFDQVNPISFTMLAGGANPLPQIVTVASAIASSPISFTQVASTAAGGAWLSVSPCNPYNCDTPYPVTVSVNASTLPPGTYTGEITIAQSSDPGMSMTVPVTLTIEAKGAFFANLPGQMSFSMQQGGSKATPQPLRIGNGGSGKLNFTVTPSTADGGSWLTTSTSAGTAPTTITVSIVPAQLPGVGLVAGTFVGQLLLVAGGDTTTIPVTVTVESAVFAQLNPLNFVMPVGGANPLPQILTVASTASALTFTQATVANSAAGGAWVSVSPCNPYSCTTPYPLTVAVVNTSLLKAGTYTGEITITQSADPSISMTVPVTLTVVATTKAFFDNVPGQTSFSLAPSGANPPSQTIQIGNGGAGELKWSVSATTADTGKWLKLTPTKGVGAGSYTVSISAKDLPEKGTLAGTFLGQQLLKTTTGDVTIPVAVTVGDPVFVQVPTVTFNTTVGVNPATQAIPVASTGAALTFTQAVATANGGAWLSVSPCDPYSCSTPYPNLTVSVNASPNDVKLAAGTYVGQINVIQSADPAESMTIPVVLNVTSGGPETPATTNGQVP